MPKLLAEESGPAKNNHEVSRSHIRLSYYMYVYINMHSLSRQINSYTYTHTFSIYIHIFIDDSTV